MSNPLLAFDTILFVGRGNYYGRDPRAPHGNYPHPYSVQPEYHGSKEGTRSTGPCAEMHFRAIGNSPKYMFTGAPHHGASFGPLALLDTRIRDDGTMNQITRITADQRFPESQTRERIETDDRILKYGTPWPLSEDFYICNYLQRLILLDRMGTKTVLCSHDQCPNIGDTMRLVEPIPVRPRRKPPVIPVSTYAGRRAKLPHEPAVISVVNINASDFPFPPDRPAKWMRIVQLFPKTTPYRDVPSTGYCPENIPRMSLGIVPVEDDDVDPDNVTGVEEMTVPAASAPTTGRVAVRGWPSRSTVVVLMMSTPLRIAIVSLRRKCRSPATVSMKSGVPVRERRSLPGEEGYGGWTYCYNLPLFARRVHDILAVIQFVHQNDKPAKIDIPGLLSRAAPTRLWLAGEQATEDCIISAT